MSDQYALHAYVLADRTVQRFDPFGRTTFHKIYQERPPEARYAIVADYNVELHRDRFLVWDLFKTLKRDGYKHLVPPEPRLTHGNLKAALMATVMLFGGE
jgi:hypothetical protein